MLISFDLDGVVMHSAMELGVFRRVEQTLALYLQEQNQQMSDAAAVAQAWKHMRECSWSSIAQGQFEAAFDWQTIVPMVQSQWGMQPALNINQLLETAIAEGIGYVEPGAFFALNFFHTHACRVVAITNGLSSYQEPCLEALQLREYFEDVFTVDRSGFAKPRPEAFWAAAPGPGASAEDGWKVHIGDRLVEDIGGSRQAGWLSILYAPQLKERWAALPPLERPQHLRREKLPEQGDLEQRRKVWEVAGEELWPHAVAVDLRELPSIVDALVAGELSHSG